MKYFIPVVMAGLLVACSENRSAVPEKHFGGERYDSTALHVALLPTHDCLPIYYAAHKGIYKKLGLKLQIASYQSQLDCDTALLGWVADGGMADRVRLAGYGKKAAGLQTMWTANNRWQLWVCSTLRIKNVKDLSGRTIAVSRQSAENAVLEQVLKVSSVKYDEVYLPQINNVKLRASMLAGNQVDATLLVWPYTSLAASAGHRCLYVQKFKDSNAVFVMKRQRLERTDMRRKWQLFEKGRRMAIDSLRLKGPAAYADILKSVYNLPAEVADTLCY